MMHGEVKDVIKKKHSYSGSIVHTLQFFFYIRAILKCVEDNNRNIEQRHLSVNFHRDWYVVGMDLIYSYKNYIYGQVYHRFFIAYRQCYNSSIGN